MGTQPAMTINILGSGTCVPSLKRSACAILVQSENVTILVDIGPGTMGQLLKLGVCIDDIDTILMSHFHLDHCAELAPFIFATKYPGFDRQKKLTLAGGTGIRKLFEKLDNTFDNHLTMPDDLFEIVELPEQGDLDVSGKSPAISYVRVEHKPESRAFRFSDRTGFSVVYSGDTDESANLIALAKDTDILICESSLPDEQKVPGHLTPSLAGKIAALAGVKKLVLTHFYPESKETIVTDQCRKTYTGPLVLAQDLMKL